MKTWTAERVALLRKLWPAGVNASDIADAMNSDWRLPNVTRNAVIGKARRIGLPEHLKAPKAYDREYTRPRRAQPSKPRVIA